jgi:hypothetical protein
MHDSHVQKDREDEPEPLCRGDRSIRIRSTAQIIQGLLTIRSLVVLDAAEPADRAERAG